MSENFDPLFDRRRLDCPTCRCNCQDDRRDNRRDDRWFW